MEETKIWSIEGTSAIPLSTTNQMESEGLLEDILTANPDMLEEGLQLVGRQTPTAGGPLDLLGVDREGRLVVFELKRGTLNREAVAQVIDYASDLDSMNLEELSDHIEEQSGSGGIEEIDDFTEWYNENHSGKNPEESLTSPRMVLVGLGVDDTTERMVNYLADSRIDISLLTFYGFKYGDKTLLARDVEIDSTGSSVADPIKEFEKHAGELYVSDLLHAATEMFGESFKYDYKWASVRWRSRMRMNFAIGSQSYLFFAINADRPRNFNIGFHPVAIDLALGEFDRLNLDNEKIPFTKESRGYAKKTELVDYSVMLELKSLEDWNTHKRQLTTLIHSIYSEYQNSQAN